MNFRDLLEKLTEQNKITNEHKLVYPKYELANYIYNNKEFPTIFNNVGKEGWKVVSGLYSKREYLGLGLSIPVDEMIPRLAYAFENPTKPEIIDNPPCQEQVINEVNLDKLPIPYFFQQDGGNYITAGIMIVKDPEYGLNACYHRLMKIGKDSFSMRMVENRDTHRAYLKSGKKLEAAVCLGNSAAAMLASSMSPHPEIFELEIANTLDKTTLSRCKTKDLLVPSNCEVVIEGHILEETAQEGPFVDLTQTRDFTRKQPVFKVDCITCRIDPIFQILLPGQNEHKLLMGMPKEPTLYSCVNKEVECTNVILTQGGGCWLHAAIQISKKTPDDGIKALKAAFQAHKSLKHAIVVDKDINIYDTEDLEWALATRFQANKDLLILHDQPSSSLDPSALHVPGEKSKTSKLGFDATIPDIGKMNEFCRVPYNS